MVEAKQDMFLDFSSHFDELFRPTFYAKVDKKTSIWPAETSRPKKGQHKRVKFGISKYRHLEYNSVVLICKTLSTSLIQEAFKLEKDGPLLSLSEPSKTLYKHPLGLKPKKLENVFELARKYVPPDSIWFYNALTEMRNDDGAQDDGSSNK